VAFLDDAGFNPDACKGTVVVATTKPRGWDRVYCYRSTAMTSSAQPDDNSFRKWFLRDGLNLEAMFWRSLSRRLDSWARPVRGTEGHSAFGSIMRAIAAPLRRITCASRD
jgi:hypothetical protein